jgi:hypothetical protein
LNGYFFRWLIRLLVWMTRLLYSNLYNKIISDEKTIWGFYCYGTLSAAENLRSTFLGNIGMNDHSTNIKIP